MSNNIGIEEQTNSEIDISMLPEDLQRDAPILTVDRVGHTEKSYMRTECYLGYVEPEKTYVLSLEGMAETKSMHVNDLPNAIKPPLSQLTGDWQTAIDLTIEDANILGGNGRYMLSDGETELEIAVAESSPEHLAYYGCHLAKIGEAVKFSSTGNLPLTITSVGEDYPDGYLLDPERGGGAYLEVHDRPHFHMPMDETCGGYLLIGKRHEGGLDELSAFKVPYGYGIHMAPWVIHSDAYLTGAYMVIYSATTEFSTVIVRKQDGELAKIRFI